jgi:hypothetical protein
LYGARAHSTGDFPMSALERQQRGLLELVKQRFSVPADPYLRRVAVSQELVLVRKIALWWRAYALEAQCCFTTRLLKHLGCFDALVANYFDHNATSPYIEELSLAFLGSLHDHGDRLIRTMSRFEYALLATRAGSAVTHEIVWDRHPDLVILALETGGELPAREPGCRYRMRVARDLPHMIACIRESTRLDHADSQLATGAA